MEIGVEIKIFKNKIKKVILEYGLTDTLSCLCKDFLKLLNEVCLETELDDIIKMTQMTILLEAFYGHLSDDSPLKAQLRNVRLERWCNHYGTPTITFLLTYHSEIEQTRS